MFKGSIAYQRAIAAAQLHHASNKTYSGKFLRPHAPRIKNIIDNLGITSILDYGCGKGRQYEWISPGGDASIPAGETIESFWKIPVRKFDPAWPPFAVEPIGEQFDLVILTHVIGSVPLDDLQSFLAHVGSYAQKALYIAEKVGPAKKRVFEMRPWTDTVTAKQLRSVLASASPMHLPIFFCTHERLADGQMDAQFGSIIDRRSQS